MQDLVRWLRETDLRKQFLFMLLLGAVLFLVAYSAEGTYAAYRVVRLYLLFVFMRYAVLRVLSRFRRK
ncbi:MAG: hypothetical protein IKH16_13515 [Selenomonadaceae bacterium]|nr:hypothetical protein [Selenomonadaceae bacterium]